MRNKRIWVSIILTFFANILCLPLWTEYGYGGFVRTLFTKEARLDLLYFGKLTRSEPFQYKVSPQPFHATWMYWDNIHRSNLSLGVKGQWQRLSLQLKAQRDGKIDILFRGPEVQDEYGAFYSVLIDWRNIKINGKTILPKCKGFSFKNPLMKQLSVKKGDVAQIEGEFRRHHFTVYDFTQLTMERVWFLITGNLLFLFLTYRLLNYIQGGIGKSDAFLLAIFFPLSFIPMIGISTAFKSVRENRVLAEKPELKEFFKERSDYGRQYESWFNDHLRGRVPLMKLHDYLRNKLSCIICTEKALYFKENGWDFLLPLIFNFDCRSSFLEPIVQYIFQLNEFCQQNRIKLYVLEVPKKEIIYKELINENYGFDEKKFIKVSRAQETIRKKVRKHRIPYIYPYGALRNAAKQDFVFFKCSHHWTDWGAFVGYRELMEEVRKDFPDMPLVSLNDYRKSQNWLYRDDYPRNYRLPWHFFQFFNDKYLDDYRERIFYTYYDHKNGDKMVVRVGKFTKEFSYPEGRRRVMLIGTSQNENFLQFLPYSAVQTRYIRLNMAPVKAADQFKILKLYKEDILAFKPDILVLSIHTDNLPELRNLFSTK